MFKEVSVSHDYSKEIKESIEQKLEELKAKDRGGVKKICLQGERSTLEIGSNAKKEKGLKNKFPQHVPQLETKKEKQGSWASKTASYRIFDYNTYDVLECDPVQVIMEVPLEMNDMSSPFQNVNNGTRIKQRNRIFFDNVHID